MERESYEKRRLRELQSKYNMKGLDVVGLGQTKEKNDLEAMQHQAATKGFEHLKTCFGTCSYKTESGTTLTRLWYDRSK